ncbi:MAG: glycoside hydrolase family 9 protein [Verrucomicrobiota bacterium]
MRLVTAGLAVACLTIASDCACAGQLPLASVCYFNPYQSPTNWGSGGSAIYQSGAAVVRNVNGTIPVDNLGGTYALVLDSVNPPGGTWSVFFKISGNPLNWLRTGTNPAIHLALKWSAVPTNQAWNMTVRIQAGPVYASAPNVDLSLKSYVTVPSNTWQDVLIPASAFQAVQPSVDLTHVWDIVLLPTGSYKDHCTLDIAALDLLPSASPAQTNYTEFVKANEVGYAPLMPSKIALVSWSTSNTVSPPPTWFRVVNVANGQVVFSNQLSRFVQPNEWQAPGWTLDGDVIYQGDFGALRTPGTYRVEAPELGASSQNFSIGTNVYQGLFRDSLRFFYYSRSGMPIVQPFAEGYTRAAIHPETTNAAYNYDPAYGHYNFGAQTKRDVHGSWFDAGDTHVDVVNTAVACWFLLETARDFGPNVPPYALDLPGSNPQQSDLVPLVSNALDWLQRMQNPDGSVCHYVLGNPDQVSDTSSFAAACAAGAFAKAYAVLGSTLTPAQASNFLYRARLSWQWLTNNPAPAWPRLPLNNGVDGGGWDTNSYWGTTNDDHRERAFAAVELFEATGEAAFNNYFTNVFLSQNGGSPLNGLAFGPNTTGYGSDNVLDYLTRPLNFAFMDYARSRRAVTPSVQATLKAAFQHQADVLTNYTALSGYRIPMLYPGHLYWGSSGGVLTPSAMVLARAFEWTLNTNYHETAIQALHFICGRNPVNRVFVSGYGDYLHGSDFYSQFWTNLLQQPPGYLGGNINVSGSATPVVEYPWKRFLNTQDADMTEPGVYWNSAFAWLAGYAANDAMLPSLQIAPAPGGVFVSWPLRSAPFRLWSAANLAPAASWALATNSPALSNRTWQIWVPAGPANPAFWRLQM